MNILFLVGLISYFNLVTCMSSCSSHQTCGACIGHAEERCVWCSQELVTGRRCQPESYYNATKSWCKQEFITNPSNMMSEKIANQFNETVQFRPQLIKIKARPGIPVKFNMEYMPAEQFPIDVYYLMDFSYTMRVHKNELEMQAKTIFEELTAMTNNVRLGVGSFVEKPELPYADIRSQSVVYSFINHLSLTTNMSLFKSVVKSAKFGGNYDDPEAGLDALMQAIVCEKEVGWREGSRRIIVLCTDNTYHSAGDGKMVGAIKPNDMKCHLNNNVYKPPEVLNFDYPSVSQINKVAKNGKFIVIFAAIDALKYVYSDLANQILGAKYAELKENNVVNIIKAAYLESVRTVELTYDRLPFVQLDIDQDCESSRKRNCESTHENPIVKISALLTVLNCTNNDNNMSTRTMTVSPVGLSDKLIIEIETDCTCECEKVSTPLSEKCNNNGSLQCGICKCKPDRAGAECQCDAKSVDKNNGLDSCKITKDSIVCSGRGTCRCGKCEDCPPGFSGEFCEYDDSMCPKRNGLLCSGNGRCTGGSCKCGAYWKPGAQKDCGCTTHNKDCIDPLSKKVCSGHGYCECGACICNKLQDKNDTYTGKFCDSCDNCAMMRCKELEDYVYCNFKYNKITCDKIFNDTSDITVFLVNKTEISSTRRAATWCKKLLDDGSFIVFKYYIDPITRKLELIIQKDLQFPAKANIWVAVGSAIGIILLIGLLTGVAWKILIDIHDKKEFEKFCKAAVAAGYDVGTTNPLYQPPHVNFVNPIFNNSAN